MVWWRNPAIPIRQSKKLESERVDASAVNAAAGALLRLKGQPVEQVELIRAMRPSTAAALCRWLASPCTDMTKKLVYLAP